ncbi:DNA polymerase iota isoform X2 [Dunckerocampus dactyliophorus]|uniref:DNA polymerase iota isoform X2 n=1 Tax=Dunckerocampus dactyliophorus TaxID=161453 RepID=UPI002405975B|nr:DNA polymerase iota isoform X2 [Dunckerocampus dactyliophorus]
MLAMENSEDEVEADETEWKQDLKDSPFVVSGSLNLLKTTTPAHRVILHFDLDCFYAQVEMLRNPALRDVPLGIQQKYIIVTCNYVARQQGVAKLMSVTDAKDKCPQLVLVKGEDLTHYREMSYQVTDLLLSFCPLVERLGFDENYVDITEMIARRLARTPQANLSFKGHVYNTASADADAKASSHPELALGSHVAAELREAIHSRLGLTGCAGIAANKLLAKLVSGTFKPNQQTTLLPESVDDIMGALSGLRKIPGVGHQTAKRLQALGLVSVQDLQLFPPTDLVREFGAPAATRLKNLSLGVDDSPVTPTGAPQSLSDEDSFKKMSSAKEVMEKIEQLLSSLIERMRKDGRQPHTFRLTIRKYSATNKWHSRESRQCPIPNHVGQKISSVVQEARRSTRLAGLADIRSEISISQQRRRSGPAGLRSYEALLQNGGHPRGLPPDPHQRVLQQPTDKRAFRQRAGLHHIFLCARLLTQNTQTAPHWLAEDRVQIIVSAHPARRLQRRPQRAHQAAMQQRSGPKPKRALLSRRKRPILSRHPAAPHVETTVTPSSLRHIDCLQMLTQMSSASSLWRSKRSFYWSHPRAPVSRVTFLQSPP